MKHVFIINPRAGKGKALELIRPQIEAYINEHNLDAELHVPDSPHAAQDFIRAEASKGQPVRFYACGGDGTLFEAVNGAFGHPNAEVAVLPLGSGNDFIRLFGTQEQFLNIDAQVNGTALELDCIKCGDKIAINQCSMGVDAEVCAKQAAFKKLPFMKGDMAYTAAAVYCVFRKLNNEFTVSIDGGEPKKMTLLFCVGANSRWYGGGYKAAPLAVPDDGVLDFIVVEKKNGRLKLLTLLPKYKKGMHLGWDITHFSRGKKMTIHSDTPAAVNIDGECEYVTDRTFEIVEKGMRFVIPTTSSYIKDRESGKISQKQ